MRDITLSVIIPAYNEAMRIGHTLERVRQYFYTQNDISYEVIVVDDGSNDATADVTRDLTREWSELKIISNEVNMGKGYSVKTGMQMACGTYKLFMDGDNSVDITHLNFFLESLKNGNDVVIGSIGLKDSLVVEHSGWHRRILGRCARMLIRTFSVPGIIDTQRGFKIFSEKAANIIFTKQTIWRFGFDIEILMIAWVNGLKIKELPVSWENPSGSKVTLWSYVQTIGELVHIVWNRMRGRYTVTEPTTGKEKMNVGSKNNILTKIRAFIAGPTHDPHMMYLSADRNDGFVYKGNEFVPHTKLDYTETALVNLLRHQKITLVIMLFIVACALLLDWHLTLTIFFSVSTIIYFFGFLFDAYVVYHTFKDRPEINVTKEEMSAIADNEWPTYTIFCPLYKEWQVVPQFVDAMQKLDYPKDKIQIMFLLEENDPETISKIREANLPEHFEIVVVPHSKPKTKPKAMNYGLTYATGEYLVIYDAEDVPDIDQLKKAVVAFRKADKNSVCIQAKLNFYNPKQNILTRIFTAEYSLWFDLVLPGLQSIAAPIPLGGTSNHFKTNILRELAGWDAFNVTEDCDLGMRLAKRGYRTSIVDSTTYEEANSDMRNWYNQRSRWIKGYIQTYFVHMRNPFVSYKGRKGLRNLILFQFIVGSKTLALFINPIMWVCTILYFSFREQVGPFIESLFPGPILYIGVFSLFFGNFLYLYYYMVGCAKRGYDDVIKYVFLVPFYWLAMSAAAWQALYEIFVKPHYWAKTVHGLHLASTAKIDWSKQNSEEVKKEKPGEEVIKKKNTFESISEFLFSEAGLLIVASVIANFINFVFNAYLGRNLSLEDFATVTVVNTFAYILALFANALSTSVTHSVSYLEGVQLGKGSHFYRKYIPRVIVVGLTATLVWIFLVPFVSTFLNMSSTLVVILFAPAIFFGIVSAINGGYLKGTWNFGFLAGVHIIEPIAKLGVAIALVVLGLNIYTPLAIPVSIVIACVVTTIGAMVVYRRTSRAIDILGEEKKFPTIFYIAALMNGLSITAFLSIDVLLAKHYLSSDDAGLYSMLSLVGKMIFFFGSLFNMFIVTLISRAEGERKNTQKSFELIFFITSILTLTASLGLVVFGPIIVPLLLGPQAIAVLPYLLKYATALALFTLSMTIVLYRLARKEYIYPILSLFMSVGLFAGIYQAHDTIGDFVDTTLFINTLFFVLFVVLHSFQEIFVYIYRNMRDTLMVVFPIPKATTPRHGKMSILILNWRDTKSVFAGGAETYVQALASRWVKDGHSVTIFTSNDGHLPMNGETDGVRIIRRGEFYATYVIAFFYYMVHFRGKFDVIVDSENGIPFFAPLYAKEPVYCLVHHVHQEVFRKGLPWPLAQFACFLEKRMMPWVYRKSNYITVSESSRREMCALGITTHNISVVHPGIDTDLLVPGKRSDTPLVSYVGRLQEHKSVHLLLQAFPIIRASLPDARLVIAGDGGERDRLERLAKKLNIEDHVQFCGKVSEERKREIMQESWVFVNPSMMEGWGITTIEANACGAPVVASDVSGLRDSVKDGVTGVLVPYGNVDKLAENITLILKDAIFRKLLSQNALEWAGHFRWEKSCDTFIHILKKSA